jgi:uncharacterized protein
MSSGQKEVIMYPEEYIKYLVHFHADRDYFECHEVLEEYWKEADPRNKDSVWVGLILFAVSAYHHRRGNFRGAERTLRKSKSILDKIPLHLQELGISTNEFRQLMDGRLQSIAGGEPYTSPFIPLADPDLAARCTRKAESLGLNWGSFSDLSDQTLIHRHSMRDRSDVIMERKAALDAGRKWKKNE